MQYRKFGNLDGVEVSALGFGCMRLPVVSREEKDVIDEDRAVAMVRHAIDQESIILTQRILTTRTKRARRWQSVEGWLPGKGLSCDEMSGVDAEEAGGFRSVSGGTAGKARRGVC